MHTSTEGEDAIGLRDNKWRVRDAPSCFGSNFDNMRALELTWKRRKKWIPLRVSPGPLASRPLDPCIHDNVGCFPVLAWAPRIKPRTSSTVVSIQFSNHSSRQTPRTIEYLSGKGPPRWCHPWFSVIFSMEQRERYSGGERGFCGQICLGNAGLSRFLCVQDVSEPLC